MSSLSSSVGYSRISTESSLSESFEDVEDKNVCSLKESGVRGGVSRSEVALALAG